MTNPYSDTSVDVEVRDSWATPDYVFDYFNDRYMFTIDGAASDTNHKLDRYLTIEDNFLLYDNKKLYGEKIWLNPPYSDITPWMDKARRLCIEGNTLTALLVPSTPESPWWPVDADIKFITRGRLAFIHPITGKPKNGNAKGSALIVFDPYTKHLAPSVEYIRRDDMRTHHG